MGKWIYKSNKGMKVTKQELRKAFEKLNEKLKYWGMKQKNEDET